jgi:hypothetical protein
MVYTGLLIALVAVSLTVYGIKTTLIGFGIIELASVLLIMVLCYREPALFSRTDKAQDEDVAAASLGQIAPLHYLVKESSDAK